jgi:hypothetical protein
LDLTSYAGLGFIWGCVASIAPNQVAMGKNLVNGAEAKELARLLVDEFAVWHRNLAEKGIVPRAFTGVTTNGNQTVVILTGLPLDHVQRRDFLIWLCRTEGFVGYAYSTRVGIVDEKNGEAIESLDIYGSSAHLDVSKTLLIEERGDGKIGLLEQHSAEHPPKPDNGLFFGLQRSSREIPSRDEETFVNLWQEIKPRAMWRSR